MKRIEELALIAGASSCAPGRPAGFFPKPSGEKYSICVIGAGDVGVNAALGLRLLGDDVIRKIGVFDPDPGRSKRAEMEIGQVNRPNAFGEAAEGGMPPVSAVSDMKGVFSHDVILFTASRGVPALDSGIKDVRLAQLEANAEIVRIYAREARERCFGGLFFIMSDPVDDLCNVMLRESGMDPSAIRGFGLGVMNARARYYAERDGRFASYLETGRAYGQHGAGLVLANSVEGYDDALSRELTDIVRKANLEVRALGFKPYIAPAFSSGAISVLETLRGNWNYGSVYIGDESAGSYFGVLSRLTADGTECEDRELPEALFGRLKESFMSLLERDKNL